MSEKNRKKRENNIDKRKKAEKDHVAEKEIPQEIKENVQNACPKSHRDGRLSDWFEKSSYVECLETGNKV